MKTYGMLMLRNSVRQQIILGLLPNYQLNFLGGARGSNINASVVLGGQTPFQYLVDAANRG